MRGSKNKPGGRGKLAAARRAQRERKKVDAFVEREQAQKAARLAREERAAAVAEAASASASLEPEPEMVSPSARCETSVGVGRQPFRALRGATN